MITSSVVNKIRSSTCAVVRVEKPHEELKGQQFDIHSSTILATGFLVRRDLVLTNRHVVEAIVTDVKKTKTLKHWYVLFTHPKAGGGLFQTYKRITNLFAFDPGGTRLDVGILSFHRADDLDEAHCASVDFADLSAIAVGVDIGICGFPLGVAVTSKALGGSRFGPVIHRGIISGLGPFDVSEPRRIVTFLTDLNTAGGLSGSPVFLPETGVVLGLHFAGVQRTLGYAIPIDQLRVQQWIDFYEKVMVRREAPGPVRVTGGGDIAGD
jgi:S1-C subfamily serine protease